MTDLGWTAPDIEGVVGQAIADAAIATAVYHEELPDRPSLPAVTYQLIAKVPVNTADGPAGYARSLMQVDAWGRDKDETARLAASIVSTLVGMTADGVDTVYQQSERSGRDATFRGRRRILEFVVHHVDPLPEAASS